MYSANQIIQYSGNLAMTVSELNADTTKQLTIESPLSGKLLNVRYTVHVDDLSNTAAIGLLVGKGQQFGEVDEVGPLYLEALRAFTGSGKVSSVEGASVPKYFFLPSQIDTDLPDNSAYEFEAVKSLDQLVRQGDNINVYFFGSSLANVLTTGDVRVSIIFEFEVAKLKSRNGNMPRGSATGMQVAILANMDNDDNIAQYYVPSNGRISNIRMSIFGAIASGFGENDFLYFGKKLFTDAQNTASTLYSHTDGVMLTGYRNLGATDPEFNLIYTVYSREIMFLKKGDPLVLNYQNSSSTANCQIVIEFDFIPDFNSKVDFWFSDKITNIPDATVNIWSIEIPFDMYVEEVHLRTQLNDLTIDGAQYLMGIKRVGELLSNIDMITGSVLSTTLVDNAQISQLPSNILGFAPFSTTSTDDPAPILAEVYDYYNEGAWIVVISAFETSSTEDLINTINIKGRSRVKSSHFGVNYLTGELVKEVGQI